MRAYSHTGDKKRDSDKKSDAALLEHRRRRLSLNSDEEEPDAVQSLVIMQKHVGEYIELSSRMYKEPKIRRGK